MYGPQASSGTAATKIPIRCSGVGREAKVWQTVCRGPEKFARGLSSPVVAGHSDAVVEAEAEGGARRLNGVVALKRREDKSAWICRCTRMYHLLKASALHTYSTYLY